MTLSPSHGLFSTLIHMVVPAWMALILFFILLKFVARRKADLSEPHHPSGASRTLIGGLAILIFALYIGALAIRLFFPGFIDPVEPLMASISYFSLHGTSVYQNIVAYGPLSYLPYGFALKLMPPGMLALKMVVVIANILLVALMVDLFRQMVEPRKAYLAAGLVVSVLLMKQSYLIQIRGDVFIFLAVALAIRAALIRRQVLSSVLFGIALGLAIGAKATAVLCLLAPCLLFVERHGRRALLSSVAVASVVNLVPFLVPTISLRQYFYWLFHMSHELRSSRELLGNLFVTAVLLLPILLGWPKNRAASRRYWGERRWHMLALVVGVLATDILAAKMGAGRHHLAPFTIVVAFYVVEMLAQQRESAPTFRQQRRSYGMSVFVLGWAAFITLVVITEAGAVWDVWALDRQQHSQSVALMRDVQGVLNRHPDQRIEMAPGTSQENLNATYSPEYGAPILAFHGNPDDFELAAAADGELLHLPVPRHMEEALTTCRTSLWLVPRTQAPFSAVSIYSSMYPAEYPGHLVFTNLTRSKFSSRHRLVGRTNFFDVYKCVGMG
ncbi:DUF2029 domain-containing protein [Alloacidobacterium dinghuense]|uniref:DUF2029 domain-containing protein n=1 Tax=Alloacidobacterium dinghuense TaxID=2763107 RepID=A0A7G8BI97_9BACT|nr:glycosyltransferase 87 family protein [Alloacidobacterium dinghuense]QNI32267.1 DUF2029 domain-containing protein [Alloacidobacterium dinghuense]